MRRSILAACVVVAAWSQVGANGGGYIEPGASTGMVTGFSPSGTEDIQILDEQLTARLQPFEAEVEVRYILKNGDRATTARFGFPIEESAGEPGEIIVDEDGHEPKPATWEEPRYCRGYSIEVGGAPVSFKFEAETPSTKAADERRGGLSGWFVSKVSFAAGEEKIMRIRYRAEHSNSTRSVSTDGMTSPRIFTYRLSTGACWNGPIAKGRVLIIPDGVDTRDVTIVKPVNRFKKEGVNWVWEFQDLEPTLADDILVEAEPSVWFNQLPEGKQIERNKVWYIAHRNYQIKASSSLAASPQKTYGAANLKDDDRETVWSEGAPGSGIGEWIEIVPEVSQPLRAIEILPGYVAFDGSLFRANARPKRVEILLNDSHRFEAKLADRDKPQRIPIEAFDKPIKKIRLTMKDVYPGSKFEDLCISSILLEAKLGKQPKIEPIR